MKRLFQNRWFQASLYGAAYIGSTIFAMAVRNQDRIITEGNILYSEINEFSASFQLHQILAAFTLFMMGYVAISAILPKYRQIGKLMLSMPMGIALWGLSSVMLLVCKVPYTETSALGAFAMAAGIIIFVGRHNLKEIVAADILKAGVIALVLANVFSTGYPRYTVTSDTYYYIYTYGRLIASAGKLDVLTAGNLIETTGIMPALMSSFAVFCGFETVNVLHFMLMSSLIVGLFEYVFRVLSKSCLNKIQIVFIEGLIIANAFSPLFLLYDLILSHSWIMVYIFFTSTMAYEYYQGRHDSQGTLLILSLFIAWLSLCRIEAVVTASFMLVCISYLGASRKEMILLSMPMLFLATVFHAEGQMMIAAAGEALPYGSVFITKPLLVMMGLVVIMMSIYIMLYETKYVIWLKERLPLVIIPTLMGIGICFCLVDAEKSLNNFHAIFFNLTDIIQRWVYFPSVAAVVLILVYRDKEKLEYLEMLTFGLIIIFFIMSMGRIHPLREGWGDSFNRYLVQMVPLVLVVIAHGVAELFARKDEADVGLDEK